MHELVGFLAAHPPYDSLRVKDLERLAAAAEPQSVVSGASVSGEGGPPPGIVRSGSLAVVDGDEVVEVLGEGDSFGHAARPGDWHHEVALTATTDSLVYLLPNLGDVLGEGGGPGSLRHPTLGRTAPAVGLDAARGRAARQARPLVWADETATAREAARAMTDAGQSCVLVSRRDGSWAIATDQDFRRLVASRDGRLDGPVDAIASSPVQTVPDDASVTAAFLKMVEHGIHHLVVTDQAGRPTGVVRVVDLAAADIRDPLVIRRAIDDAATTDEIAAAAALLPATMIELAGIGVSPQRVGALCSMLRDRVLVRLLEVNRAGAVDGVDVSWLVLGSSARREALPGSDADTALVWVARDDGVDDAQAIRAHAEQVLVLMERCGLRRCPDGANATNPLFSRSAADWIAASERWIGAPTAAGALLLASIVTDSRAVTNRGLTLGVIESMSRASDSPAFLDALLRFILQNRPPTGLVRDFVVEHAGDHRGQLDLKHGGLLPLAGLGRWLALATGDIGGSTVERIRRGAQAGLVTVGEADALEAAFEEVYGLLFERDLADVRSGVESGSHVDPDDLDPLTRRFLRETFREIRQVQKDLHARWQARPRPL